MKLGIVGYGIVGKATHKGILNNRPVVIHDLSLGTSIEDLYNCDYVFFCVPTDSITSVQSLVDDVKNFKAASPNSTIIIRSTLPVGTCKEIQQLINDKIFYMPEFLRDRAWETDCLNRPIVVGHDGLEIPSWLLDDEYVECSTSEAEVTKMFSNNFAVVRIAFANLFYDLSQKVGADYDVVKDLYFKTANDQSYLNVPGHDGTRGFGGKCLPKDLDFVINSLDELGIGQTWLNDVRRLNQQWQQKF